MMKRIVVASDSFKGSLGSAEIVGLVRRTVAERWPGCPVDAVSVADGGEGTAAAFVDNCGYRPVQCRTEDALRRPIEAWYALSADGTEAVIDTAAAAGLSGAMRHDGTYDPMRATTVGLGLMMRHALEGGAQSLVLGLGGSATTDCGTGMLAALGWIFEDEFGQRTGMGGGSCLSKITRVIPCPARIPRLTALCDVAAPLYGSRGAACVFGPQKGADPAQVLELDRGLRHIAAIIDDEAALTPGAGAAGGLGYAVRACLGGTLQSGIDRILDSADFDSLIAGADLVLTGEGCYDSQTGMGKAVSGIVARCRRAGVPVALIAGRIADGADTSTFAHAVEVTPRRMPLAEAMQPDTARRLYTRALDTIL